MRTRVQFVLSTTAYLLVCWHCLVHHRVDAAVRAPVVTAARPLRTRPSAAPAPRAAPAPAVVPPLRAVAPAAPPSPLAGDDAELLTSAGLQRAIDQLLAARSVTFAPSSDVITSEGRALVVEVAALLLRAPQWRVEVAGHTDDVGTPDANVDMSARRAAAVARALAERGVAYRRIRVVGKGAAQPVADNATAEGRARNRRIQFTVIRGGGA